MRMRLVTGRSQGRLFLFLMAILIKKIVGMDTRGRMPVNIWGKKERGFEARRKIPEISTAASPIWERNLLAQSMNLGLSFLLVI